MTRRDVLPALLSALAFVLLWGGIVTLIVVTLHYAVWLWARLGPA